MMSTQDISHPDTLRHPLQPCQPPPHPCPRDPPPLKYDFPLPSTSRFPISSIRRDAPPSSSARPPAHHPKHIYPRYDPLHILSQPAPPPPRVYAYVAPAPSVAPGILADGVLTAKLPAVRRFLDAATIAPPDCPPLPTDRRVLALVALSVFYHPLHPAHWAFWNREQKKDTALLVQSVLDTTPTPILSPIGWMDVPESLWVLKTTQSAYAPRLAPFPWYATYTSAEPETRMSLRKRKPAQSTTRASGDDTAEDDERLSPPPRKRPRTRKSTASRSTASKSKSFVSSAPENKGNKQEEQPEVPEPVQVALLLTPDNEPTLTKAAKRERIESPDTVLSATVPDGSVQPDPPDAEEVPELRKSVRQRERRAKAASSASPASFASTLTPSVRARGLSQARTSRESSAVTPESVGGGESGSSTAVSLCEEEETKSKATKVVEEVADDIEAEDDVEGPPTKKPRISRPRAKSGSRAKTGTKNKTDTVTDEAETITTAQARPKARSRAKTRRR